MYVAAVIPSLAPDHHCLHLQPPDQSCTIQPYSVCQCVHRCAPSSWRSGEGCSPLPTAPRTLCPLQGVTPNSVGPPGLSAGRPGPQQQQPSKLLRSVALNGCCCWGETRGPGCQAEAQRHGTVCPCRMTGADADPREVGLHWLEVPGPLPQGAVSCGHIHDSEARHAGKAVTSPPATACMALHQPTAQHQARVCGYVRAAGGVVWSGAWVIGMHCLARDLCFTTNASATTT
jgi:hypothetical protein